MKDQNPDLDDAAATLAVAGLMGVWRRALLVTPDGRRDSRSEVYWLQAQTICGDMRCEAGGAAPSGPGRLKAFAGRLTERGGIFRWERSLASFPLDGPPDDGRLRWDGDALREDGVHEAYWEIWVRVAIPAPGDYAMELIDPRAGRSGYLLSIGPYAFFARGGAGLPHRPGDCAFGFAGPDADGREMAFSTFANGGNEWAASLPPRMDEETLRISERGADGTVSATIWSVAALERPYAKRMT